jgi:hypothetical protein
MATTPTTEPVSLIAGDTAKWLKTLADYPATDGWVLTYTLINAASKITITASASGSDHLVNVAAATTTGWAAGAYSWRSRVSLGAEVYTVGSGTITVQASFGAATLENRSFAAKALENIEAYLLNTNNLSASMYEIAGRKLQRFPIEDLLAMRDKYRGEVAREKAAENVANGQFDNRRVFVRFGP